MTTTTAIRRAPGFARIRESLPERFAPYAYIAPFFILFGVFGLFPMVYTFFISLFEWDPLGNQDVRRRPQLQHPADRPPVLERHRNTLSIWFLSTVPQSAIALGLAHLLHAARLRFANFFRMSLLVPYITSVAATSHRLHPTLRSSTTA